MAGAAFALYAHRPAEPCVSTPQVQPPSTDDPPLDDDDHADLDDSYTLVIEQSNDGCEYFSSFDDDAVQLAPGTKLAIFERDFAFEDGCDWKSEEKLERIDNETFRY